MGDAREIAAYADENTLTQAMIRLISPEARVVYFLTGHGEPDLQASDPSSMLRARQTLESKNYTSIELNSAATNTVPEDAKAVLMLAPHLLDQARLLKRIHNRPLCCWRILSSSSRLVLKIPWPYLERWAITLQDTVVIDLTTISRSAPSPPLIAPRLRSSRTTSFTIMPQHEFGIAAHPPDVTLTPLILTAQQSWARRTRGLVEPDVAFDERWTFRALTWRHPGECRAKDGGVWELGLRPTVP
jgi:hypothetical protein